jgi:hypothetical protein
MKIFEFNNQEIDRRFPDYSQEHFNIVFVNNKKTMLKCEMSSKIIIDLLSQHNNELKNFFIVKNKLINICYNKKLYNFTNFDCDPENCFFTNISLDNLNFLKYDAYFNCNLNSMSLSYNQRKQSIYYRDILVYDYKSKAFNDIFYHNLNEVI